MLVTLLYFDDCPNWTVTDQHLRALAADHPEMVIEHQLVETVEDAEAARFRGSPGIVVDKRKWHMVIEKTMAGETIRTRPLDRPVLYQRGKPVGAPE